MTLIGLLFFIFYFLFSPVGAQAQDSLLLRDYQFVKQADPWLTIQNASALTRYQRQGIAEASLSLTYSKGKLQNYYESPRVLQAGAQIEAFQRISRRTVVFGSMSYDNFSGRDMAGSAFINPSRKPFDISEDSLTNSGTKHRDTYLLTGGFGIDIWNGYSVGARVEYTSANYAKYRDLRHKNKLMNLLATAGVYAPITPWLNVGASYTYHRQTESVTFSTYGNNDKVYKSFIDYGAFSGRIEQFGDEGFTRRNHDTPLFEDGHGGDLQIEVLPLQQLSVFDTIGINGSRGYYGRKSPYDITYTHHSRSAIHSTAAITYTPAHQLHRLSLNYSLEKLKNFRNTYREVKNDFGAYYYDYFGDVRMGNKQWMDLTLDYTANLGIQHELPRWVLQLTTTFNERRQVAYQHPYKRKQKLNTADINLQGTRNIVLKHGVLSANVHLGYRKGHGTPFADLVDAVPSDKQQAPPTMEPYLYREYQYLTVPQYRMGTAVKYAFIMPKTRIKMHAKISGDYQKATKTCAYSTGSHHLSTAIAIGCTF